MDRIEAYHYFRSLEGQLKNLPSLVERRNFFSLQRQKPLYEQAANAARAAFFIPISQVIGDEVFGEEVAQQTDDSLVNSHEILQTLDRSLTRREQTVLWAQKVSYEYQALSQTNSAQRKRASRFLDRIALKLLQEPQDFDAACETWISEGDKGEENSFYKTIKEQLGRSTKEEWRTISDVQLAEIVRVIAHTRYGVGLAGYILETYFRSPSSRNDRVRALHKFACGVIDLVDDQPSLEWGVKIAEFETDLLPRNGAFCRDFMLSTNVPLNDVTLGQAMNVDKIMLGLYGLAGFNPNDLRTRTQQFMATDPDFLRKVDELIEKLSRRSSAFIDEYNIKKGLLNRYYAAGAMLTVDEGGLTDLLKTWPYNIVYDPNDELRRKFALQGLQRYTDTEVVRRQAATSLYGPEADRALKINIQTPEGTVLNILIPPYLTHRRDAVIRACLLESEESRTEVLSRQPTDPNLTFFVTSPIIFDGHEVFAWVRPLAGFEARQHPMTGLGEIGFPSPKFAGESITDANRLLAQEIRTGRIRFLDFRGVRALLRERKLRDLGYKELLFYKDRTQRDQAVAHVCLAGLPPYEIKINRNFQFNLEGRSFPNQELAENLRYTFLSYLKAILCDRKLKIPGLSEEEGTLLVESRCGHLRFLPLGYTYTNAAASYCLEYEGWDLVRINHEDKPALASRLGKTPDQDITYVRPVMTDGSELDPVEVHLPEQVHF